MKQMSNVSLLVRLDFVPMGRVLGLRNVVVGVVLGGLFRLVSEFKLGDSGVRLLEFEVRDAQWWRFVGHLVMCHFMSFEIRGNV
jgi:hypothetical protein